MGTYDFVVDYDSQKDSVEDVTKRIFYSLFIKRIKKKKPCVIFVSGDSGEGKSYGALKLQELILDIQGFKHIDVLEKTNIYSPLEYARKLDNLLKHEPKKLNCLIIHEARELVKAKNWHSFINQTISDVNAMSRTIKRMVTIIISQFIRDIDTDVRYTIHYYVKMSRPLSAHRSHLTIYKLWKDDRDIHNPMLRKRKVRGYLRVNGRYRKYMPQYFELSKPAKEVTDEFDRRDYEAKAHIIRGKLNKMLKEMAKELEVDSTKVDAIVKFYSEMHPEQLYQLGKVTNRGFKFSKHIKEMHDLSADDIEELKTKIDEKLKQKELISEGENG